MRSYNKFQSFLKEWPATQPPGPVTLMVDFYVDIFEPEFKDCLIHDLGRVENNRGKMEARIRQIIEAAIQQPGVTTDTINFESVAIPNNMIGDADSTVSVMVYIKIMTGNSKTVPLIIKKIEKTIAKKFHGSYLSNFSLSCHDFPSFPISAEIIELHIDKLRTLRRVHERLQCNRLILVNSEAITGGVLDLMRVKGLKNLEAYTAGTDKPAWVDIISMCIDKNKSILEAQEMLIDNNLEDYADF